MFGTRSVERKNKSIQNPNAKARNGYSLLLNALIIEGNLHEANSLIAKNAEVNVKEFQRFCSPSTAKLLRNLILYQQIRLSPKQEAATQFKAKRWFQVYMPKLFEELERQNTTNWIEKCKDIHFALLARLSFKINGQDRSDIKDLADALGLTWIKTALLRNPFLNVGKKGELDQHQLLLAAVEKNNTEKMICLIAAGAKLCRSDFSSTVSGYGKLQTFESPIHKAAEVGSKEALLLLLEMKLAWNELNKQKMTPYDVAAFYGQIDIMRILQNKGSSPVNKNHPLGVPPLFCAVAGGNLKSVLYLLKKGAGINDRENCYNKTPLHLASYGNHTNVIDILLQNGASINSKDNNGKTPLHEAVEAGNINCVKMLLKHGAKVDTQDKQGQTPLDIAHNNKNNDIENLLKTHKIHNRLNRQMSQWSFNPLKPFVLSYRLKQIKKEILNDLKQEIGKRIENPDNTKNVINTFLHQSRKNDRGELVSNQTILATHRNCFFSRKREGKDTSSSDCVNKIAGIIHNKR